VRITVDIEDEKLRQVLAETGERKKSPAVAKAIDAYLDMKARQGFAGLIREKRIQYSTTNEEIESDQEERGSALDRRRE
jgi:hypothetical protein